MEIVVHIDQPTAIRAGHDIHGDIPMEIPMGRLPADVRDELARIVQSGRGVYRPAYPLLMSAPTVEDLCRSIRGRIWRRERETAYAAIQRRRAEARYIRDAAAWAALPVDQRPEPVHGAKTRYPAALAEYRAYYDAQARQQARAATWDAAHRRALLGLFIAQHTPHAKRWRAGWMTAREALDLYRDHHAPDGCGPLPEDIEHEEWCDDDDDVSTDEYQIGSLSAAQWARLTALRAEMAPGLTAIPRRIVTTCDGCAATETRVMAEVEMDHGAIQMTCGYVDLGSH